MESTIDTKVNQPRPGVNILDRLTKQPKLEEKTTIEDKVILEELVNVPIREYTVYYSTIPNSQYLFKDGTAAEFTGGRFLTDDSRHITELDAEIARKHQFISKGLTKITDKDLDPIAEIKRKAVEEYVAKQKAATNPTSDKGTSIQAPLMQSAANSNSIAVGAASSVSGQPG